jgi:hypothetical protein
MEGETTFYVKITLALPRLDELGYFSSLHKIYKNEQAQLV